MPLFEGFHVITDDSLTEPALFIRGQSRFVEYDESDYWWLVKYGFAEWTIVPSKKAYQIGTDMLLMHSATWEATWEAMRKVLEKRNRQKEAVPWQRIDDYVKV